MGRRRRRPHWTTIIAIVVILLAVLFATQVTGPRPTLVDEGSLAAPAPAAGTAADELSGTPGRSPS